MSYLEVATQTTPMTEHYKRYLSFKSIVSRNLLYINNMDFDLAAMSYIDRVFEYRDLTSESNINFLNELFDFINIPDELTFKEKICYYQLIYKVENNHE